MKYLVIEIQSNIDGTAGSLVYSYDTLADAYEKFYAVLGAAVKSAVLYHSAMIVNSEAKVIDSKSFPHPVEPVA